MTLPTSRYLKNKAAKRLAAGKDPKAVVLWYAGITALASLVVTIAQYFLENAISQSGGLTNMNSRAVLSTIDRVLPILESVLVMGLTLGYTAAILRIVRNQYSSPKTLKAGFERFGLLLKTRILLSLMFLAAAVPITWLTMQIFMVTPMASELTGVLTSLTESGNYTAETLMQNEEVINAVSAVTLPVMGIFSAVYIPVCLFIQYRYRLTDCLIIDHPELRAREAMRQSRQLMNGNCGKLFLIDLSLWWYYLLKALPVGILYLDTLLGLAGITLPLPDTAVYFLTVAAYLGADFAVTFFFRNRTEAVYALAYTSLAPKPVPAGNGAVLGNIFRM